MGGLRRLANVLSRDSWYSIMFFKCYVEGLEYTGSCGTALKYIVTMSIIAAGLKFAKQY